MEKNSLKYNQYSIIDVANPAPDTVVLTMKGHINFKPGQFVQASVDHYGEATFAITSDPKRKDSFELCIRGVGSTTRQMIKLLPGDTLNIRGPYGNHWPAEKLINKDVVIISGGMGIVPLRPLIFNLLKKKVFYKNLHFIAGFKTDEHLLFEDDLKEWKDKFDSFSLYAEHTKKSFWGKRGLITEPIKQIKLSPKSIVLICGPEIMFDHCATELIKKGIPESNIYVSFERRMECGIGICQHCNVGKFLVCKDGPVFRWDIIKGELGK